MSGHLEPILNTQWDANGDRCLVTTINTGIQSGPEGQGGKNVPTSPGTHLWSVSGIPSAQNITLLNYPAGGFWNTQGFTYVESTCYQRWNRNNVLINAPNSRWTDYQLQVGGDE